MDALISNIFGDKREPHFNDFREFSEWVFVDNPQGNGRPIARLNTMQPPTAEQDRVLKLCASRILKTRAEYYDQSISVEQLFEKAAAYEEAQREGRKETHEEIEEGEEERQAQNKNNTRKANEGLNLPSKRFKKKNKTGRKEEQKQLLPAQLTTEASNKEVSTTDDNAPDNNVGVLDDVVGEDDHQYDPEANGWQRPAEIEDQVTMPAQEPPTALQVPLPTEPELQQQEVQQKVSGKKRTKKKSEVEKLRYGKSKYNVFLEANPYPFRNKRKAAANIYNVTRRRRRKHN